MDEIINDEKIQEIKQWSTFVLDDAFEGKRKMIEKLKQLEEETAEELEVNTESVREFNFIAYLHWRLNDKEKAFATMEHAKKRAQGPNLIMQSNNVIFHIETGKYFQAHKLLRTIENDTLKETIHRSRALAEMAYYYSRLGPEHHGKAVRLFRKAIEDIQPERNVYWEYGLALTLRRQSHPFQMLAPETFTPTEYQKEAASLLYRVLKFPLDGYSKIKAQAWCEMSKILRNNKTLYEIISTDKAETEKINENRCFEEAKKLSPDEIFFLQSYGSHLRYRYQLDKSKITFERAIRLRDTPFSRHHLALTLKKMVEKENPRSKCRRNLEYSYPRGKNQHPCLDRYDSGIASMTDHFDSLSLDVDRQRRGQNAKRNERTTHTNFGRSQRVDSHHHYIRQKPQTKNDCTPTNAQIYFCVPKFPPASIVQLNRGRATNDCSALLDKAPFFHHQSVSKKGFISMRKSPKFVCVSPNNPLLFEAVEHLKKAIAMSAGFDIARYDLGLIYRMLDNPSDARDCFSYITSNNCGKPSGYHLILINAYEQQAMCNETLLQDETDIDKRKELEYDIRANMWKALSAISGVITALPMLKTTNHCFPTLKTLLEKEDTSTKKLKELAKLHELLDYTEASITFYQEIIEIECNPTNVKTLIKNYLKIGNFDKAVCTLSLLQCTEELGFFDKSFYVDTYIKGALDSLKKKDFEMAKIRFLKAYETIMSETNTLAQGKKGEQFPDILILDSCCDGNACRWIQPIFSTLKSFIQLQVAVNHTDCPPGGRLIKYMEKTMLQARCIILILHNCDEAKKDEFMELVLELLALHYRGKTLLIRIEGCNLTFPGCKELVLSRGHVEMENKNVMQGTVLSNILISMTDMFLIGDK